MFARPAEVRISSRAMQSLELTVHDQPDAADARIVDAGLGESNEAAAPLHEVRPLA